MPETNLTPASLRLPTPSLLKTPLALGLLVALLAVLGTLHADLLTGSNVPFYRDIGTTQRPAWELFEKLGSSSISPHLSFGQPYLGNPNFVLAYPFPKSPRFLGAHLVLHVAIALAGMTLVLLRFVRNAEAAVFGGAAWAFSGYVFSCTAFVNAITTVAWIPWVVLAVLAAPEAAGLRQWVLSLGGTAVTIALLVTAGEPALGVLGLGIAFISALFLDPERVRNRLAVFFGGGLLAALLTAPWLLAVLRSTTYSSRRLRGFSWTEFAAAGFHPGRLLETPFPFLFGDPSRLVSGGFWGFSVTQGNPPYLTSLHFGVLALVLAAVFVISPRRAEAKVWIGMAAAAFVASLTPWIPGASTVYGAFPFLHSLRYPIKAMLVVTFCLAVLSAFGADRLLMQDTLYRFRKRASWSLAFLALCFALLAVWARLRPEGVSRILRLSWDDSWVSRPSVVLDPVVQRFPAQAALVAGLLLFLSWSLRHSPANAPSRVALLVLAGLELSIATFRIIPRVPAEWYATPSPLVQRAASLGGRTFERTAKDIDAVRRGVFGKAPADSIASVTLAQILQGWAQSGAPHGILYAYDQDPDGSYSLLDRMARDMLLSRRWDQRLKWLRSAGVSGIIAHDVPEGLPGLELVIREDRVGIPTALYRVEGWLPGVRRVPAVFGSGSVTEAVRIFESEDFEPEFMAVVSGTPPAAVPGLGKDPEASAAIVEERPDSMIVKTAGSRAGLLHIARTYTPSVNATVNGQPAEVRLTNLHLTGVVVPAGTSTAVISFVP
ncbi:MAG: hypothetical protein L6R30_16295 [Thermoanaerobaculia bacterium]|nr:hypothetical protein [Thermoanaerobaculia bacterium]